MLFLTGSGEFNRALSVRARFRGLALSMRQLRPVLSETDGRGWQKGHGEERFGDPIPCPTEGDVFEAIGVAYYEPSDR